MKLDVPNFVKALIVDTNKPIVDKEPLIEVYEIAGSKLFIVEQVNKEGEKVEIQAYLNDITKVFTDEMKDNLVGVYLHGSLAMKCFNPETSDVDILVICKSKMTNEEKKTIIQRLLKLTQGNRNQLEMSIVLERVVKDFVYPTPFELHYFHPTYLLDENYICGGEGFFDPDLAGHMVVTYHRGVTLSGEKIENVFKPIEWQYYIESIFNDVEDAPKYIIDNPVYFTLNLCRVMYFLKEGKIASKK